MRKVAEAIVTNGLSVREVEKISKIKNNKKEKRNDKRRDSFFDEVEISLHEYLGRKVKVSSSAKNKGSITIEFYNKEDLAEIVKKLAGED